MTGPLRVLVLCTANSARSQMAAALLSHRGGARILAESAGAHPGSRVHPQAIQQLEGAGIPVEGLRPKRTDEVIDEGWDLVITVCDQAQEACPVLPGATLSAHWGVEDPAGAPDEVTAFSEAFRILAHRVDRLLSLPLESMNPVDLRAQLIRIGTEGTTPSVLPTEIL